MSNPLISRIIDDHVHLYSRTASAKVAEGRAHTWRVPPACYANGPETFDPEAYFLFLERQRSFITQAVNLPVAHAPQLSQITALNAQCAQMQKDNGGRIVSLGAIHPLLETHELETVVQQICDYKFPGVKLHSPFQQFNPLDSRLTFFYQLIRDHNLTIVWHTGASDFHQGNSDYITTAATLAQIYDRHGLPMVAAHGGARPWQEVKQHFMGREIYVDISFTLPFVGRSQAYPFSDYMSLVTQETLPQMIMDIGHEKIMFGSDFPFTNPYRAEQLFLAACERLESGTTAAIAHGNAERLFLNSSATLPIN